MGHERDERRITAKLVAALVRRMQREFE